MTDPGFLCEAGLFRALVDPEMSRGWGRLLDLVGGMIKYGTDVAQLTLNWRSPVGGGDSGVHRSPARALSLEDRS